ncbi:MAG: 16S rRNA (guanine(527)-N(7))-methyltransferase RsmG [Clostridia bacterium]|nr:16S rRNA (guanine(527)-N(7))-methyltransferase RsmG [Clostridia bacterium]
MSFCEKYFEIMDKNFPDKRYSTDELAGKFEILYNELVAFNEKVNLTAVTDIEGVIAKHFADSLLIEEYIPEGSEVIDVGCGGGFPTLPLAIVRKDLEITALDSTQKKLNFVSEMAQKLSLNVSVLCARAEETARKDEYRESFDVCVARAVARLNILSELCIPLVKKGGLFISCKAAIGEEEYREAKNGTELLGAKTKNTFTPILHTVTEEQKRSIFIFEKVEHTPQKYPRQYAKITKKPL